ncbi:MAG: sulfatase-like hydrolase/transferase, partial [Myxococcota bacterium]
MTPNDNSERTAGGGASTGGGAAARAAAPGRDGRRRAGFGLVYALSEAAIAYLPNSMNMHLQAPLHAILKAEAFDVAFFALVGLAAAPLLRKKRGGLWHTLALAGVVAALSVWLTPAFLTAMLFSGAVLVATVALHALGLRLGRSARLRPLRLPAAVLLIIVVFMLPKLAVPAPPVLPAVKHEARAGAPNLLLIVTDTVRADHVNLYGYRRETAPHLAALAKEGTLFERALAVGTWTIPSHASMFTGKYPSAHGAHHEGNHLAYENITLAEVLHVNGYTTVGFNSNPFMTASNGFTQGFERMEPSWLMMTAPMTFLAYRIGARTGLVFEDHGAREVTERFTAWVGETWDGEKPFFAFLNYIEAHFPYHVMPLPERDHFLDGDVPVRAMRNASDAAIGGQLFGDPVAEEQIALVRDLYDAGIRYEDALIARVIDTLRARGVLDDTVVMIVSDHGELFGEHGLYGHEMSLSERLLHVPWLIRYPKRVPSGLRISVPVSTAAVFHTALDLLGIAPPEPPQVRSVVRVIDGIVSNVGPILSEQHRFRGLIPGTYKPQGPFDQMNIRYRAIEEGGYKLIVDSKGNRWLYRPKDDPEELKNLAEAEPGVVKQFQSRLDAVVASFKLGDIDADKLG